VAQKASTLALLLLAVQNEITLPMNRRTGFLSFLAALLLWAGQQSGAQIPEAADKAFTMAAKYSAMSYYMTPNKEGWAGYGVTLEFVIPVSVGLDYIFILAGDSNCLDPDVWIETEQGNVLVKDTRRVENGLCGVRWRSDYSGTVNCVVHFHKVKTRCAWAALVGRRGTPTNAVPNEPSSASSTLSNQPRGGRVEPVGPAEP
jgi:hypothetical protein